MTTSRHIAFCLPALAAGGMEQVTLTLAGALAARGHRIDLILERRQGAYLDRVPAGVHVLELGKTNKWHACHTLIRALPKDGLSQLYGMLVPGAEHLPLGRLTSFADYLRGARPDVLITAHGRLPLLSIWARAMAGVDTRVLIVEHSTLSRWLQVFADQSAKHRRWQYRVGLARRLYPKADAIAGVSQGVADDLTATLGLRRGSVATLYNPVVSDLLVARARDAVSHHWFAPEAPPVVLAVGRLVQEKNFAELIDAFAVLRDTHRSSARLMIVGEGEERDALQQRIDAHGLHDVVQLAGWADNPYALMARSAVFVLCSLFEGLGIVLIEAMACGCPVVATDCPSGPREILEGGAYGRLVPMHDVSALATAIAATLDADTDNTKLIERAGHFSVARAVDAYEAIIEGLFAGNANSSNKAPS